MIQASRGFTLVLVLLGLNELTVGLDPAAYGNPSGQLRQAEVSLKESYQERYTLIIANRDEACFFLENMKEGYIFSVHYLVISTKNGNQLDISMRLKDPNNKLVTFQARKREGHYTDYRVVTPGDYELCFNNKYSMYEHKKMMFEVDIEGDEEENSEEGIVLAVNRTMEEFSESAKDIKQAISKVRNGVARARHQQYWIKSKSSKDIERLGSLVTMIDRWSAGYSVLVGVVGILQILILRSFFNVKPPTSNLRVRT